MRQWIAERPFLQRLLTWGTMLLVVATLLILANTLPDAIFRRGNGLFDLLDALLAFVNELPAPAPLILPPSFWRALSAGFWMILLLTVVYLIFTKDGRREIPGLIRLLLRGFIIAWLVLIVLRFEEPEAIEEEEQTSGEPADLIFDDIETNQLAEQLEEVILELPDYPSADATLVVLGIMFGLMLLFLLARWRQYRRDLEQVAEMPVDELRLRAMAALQELRQGNAPLADVIHRCYREMVQTVHEQRGVYRERHVTPREFEERLLKSGFPQPPVQRLTRLFEQVRYGNASAGEREKRQAIDSLEQIVAACEQMGRRGGRRP